MSLTETTLSDPGAGEIYAAALRVFRDQAFPRFTHEHVAELSGAREDELRCRWPRPADLLVDALAHGILVNPEDPGDRGLRLELLEVTIHMATEFALHGDLLVALMSRLPLDEELNQVFRERIVLPRTEIARKIFGRAMLRGEMRPDADPRLVFSVLPALMTYRAMIRDPAPDPAVAEHLVDTLILPHLLLRA
ncbi:TetR-like C-terminal domain-containing protein [Actinocorallia longicatena]|uniref:Tetracyclin repressor-like C-terminal domain-containing protein n=1 Tax=Actinocorallia longicatena TaxID=111803 RepID=A0ABP6QR55_9ACTN